MATNTLLEAPRVGASLTSLYAPTGKAGRLASANEAGQLAAALVAAALQSAVTPDPRCILDDLSPDTCGFKPAGSEVKWQTTVANIVAGALGCRVRRERANFYVIAGPAHLTDPARWLVGRLIQDVGPFMEREYLKVFYYHRDRGEVELARGARARIMDEVLEHLLVQVTAAYAAATSADPHLTPFLAECARLTAPLFPTDGPRSKTRPVSRQSLLDPSASKPTPDELRGADRARRLSELNAKLSEAPTVGQKLSDEELRKIYRGVLERSHGLQPGGPATGHASFTGARTFSISAAVMAAEERLGDPPTHYEFRYGNLYLSRPGPAPSPVFRRVATTAGG